MKLKNIFKKRPSKYKLLEDKIKSLEDRTFEKKKENNSILPSFYYSWSMGYNYEPISLEEEISILQDKLDVIAKHLGLVFEETREKEKEWTVKPIKPKKK